MIRTTRPAKLSNDDPRLAIVIAAGALRAEDAFLNDGWRRAPAQCPIHMLAIKDASVADMLALANAWNKAFHGRILELQAA
jgi:hypothetical protein